MALVFADNPALAPQQIAALREAVGWDGRAEQIARATPSYLRVACFDGEALVGYVDVVSDGQEDAYVRDLMVHPAYQRHGIGLALLDRVLRATRARGIKMVNVVFAPHLTPLYRRAGFYLCAGGLLDHETMPLPPSPVASAKERATPPFDPVAWLGAHIPLRDCTSAELLYDHMESQSGRSLPILYQPFDATRVGHFQDRACALDFSLSVGGGRLLDFGPGDGWPSLIVAPWAQEVVGVDGSARRVQVCAVNAARLGIHNARFVHVPPGQPLPFPVASFDGAMAASSLEQTPDPRQTLGELYRVLKPGGKLRLSYEALGRYAGGQEREVELPDYVDGTALLLYERHLASEWALQLKLPLALSHEEALALLGCRRQELAWSTLRPETLSRLLPHLREGLSCVTQHPSGHTWRRWMEEVGFRTIQGTHDGNRFARDLVARLAPAARPRDLAAVDDYLRPLVGAVIALPAPIHDDPWITATK
jgi:SAM-dependent methyltransferase/GNAT superfamily N-acetyltransferase